MEVNYRTTLVGGNTIMDLRANICPENNIYLFFKFDFDYEKEEDKALYLTFDIPYFASNWSRGLLSYAISSLDCSQRSRDLLAAVWMETIYYHLDYVLQLLRLPDSPCELREAVFFNVDLVPTSPQAIENLGLPTDCCSAGNLLERIELYNDDDDDDSSWKDDDCSICLDKFDDERRGKDLTSMPCSHSFHYKCLAEWLPGSQNCPVCRYQLKWKTKVVW